MKTVPILFTFDQSLELAAGVCLTSLLESAEASTFYDIFVLHGPGCDFSGSRLNALPERYGAALSGADPGIRQDSLLGCRCDHPGRPVPLL